MNWNIVVIPEIIAIASIAIAKLNNSLPITMALLAM
jgi:hypothetical protein